MKVIGLAGFAGSGKDSLVLAVRACGVRVETLAFGDAVKKATGGIFDLTERQLYVDKDVVDPRWGHTPRQLLWAIGNAARAKAPRVWTEKVRSELNQRRQAGCPLVFVTDVRLDVEYEMLEQEGCVFWWVDRPAVYPRGMDGRLLVSGEVDESERMPFRFRYAQRRYHERVANDGTLADLHYQAEVLVERWQLKD